MNRFVALLAMVTGLLVPLTVTTAPAAQAYCPPPDGSPRVIYKFRDADYRYYPTNIKSDWVVFPPAGAHVEDEAYFLHHIVHTIEGALAGSTEVDAPALAAWVALRHAQIERAELTYIAHQLDAFGRAP